MSRDFGKAIGAAANAVGAALVGVLAMPAIAAAVPLKAATMIIEYNASAEDVGIQFFLDSDGWRTVRIFDPAGNPVFHAQAEGSLTDQGGGTELFLESVEPTLGELPLEDFFARFPEGTYRFIARDNEGVAQKGRAEFTHTIPEGPVLVTPVPDPDQECATAVARPVVIAWEAVTQSISAQPLDIVGYELIVENDELNLDYKLPASAGTLVTISPEVLEPRTRYDFEVLAIEASGNQSITEGCFKTGR